MAQVMMEKIVDHLSSEIRKALAQTIRSALPEATFDEYELFREFKRNVRRKCSNWETVPDQYVQVD